MAKKSRRARRQERPFPPPAPSPIQTGQAPQPAAMPNEERPFVVTPAPRKQVDFASEYRYVINDLRNMAFIALAMLAVLVALSFVVR